MEIATTEFGRRLKLATAFNDYLSWPDEPEYELEVRGAANCTRTLEHAANAAWLRDQLQTCHPSNSSDIQARLSLAEAEQGETLFDVLKESSLRTSVCTWS